jgi:hypothetical protein
MVGRTRETVEQVIELVERVAADQGAERVTD